MQQLRGALLSLTPTLLLPKIYYVNERPHAIWNKQLCENQGTLSTHVSCYSSYQLRALGSRFKVIFHSFKLVFKP